ncbi:hypothetical protein AX16_009378 [Volvariella volvacea WC 439]|nr:hypothetical protein AX16_009378 [Volvariella volvacea WC 439]
MLESRSAQTSALCQFDFAWLDNQKAQTPCLVAAYALGACAEGSIGSQPLLIEAWMIEGLLPNQQYDVPNATTANPCYCSWTAYNLLSGCTACQGVTPQSWPSFVEYCPPESRSDTFWPPKIPFPPQSAIPYWATTNPPNWPSDRFSVVSAKSLWAEGRPDVIPSPASTGSSSLAIGAVVGIAIGSFFFLASVILIVVLVIKRRRAEQVKPSADTPSLPAFVDVNRQHYPHYPLSGSTMANNSHSSGFGSLWPASYITSPLTSLDNHHINAVVTPTASPPLQRIDGTVSRMRTSTGTENAVPIHAVNQSHYHHHQSIRVRPQSLGNNFAIVSTESIPSPPARRFNPPPYSPAAEQRGESEAIRTTPSSPSGQRRASVQAPVPANNGAVPSSGFNTTPGGQADAVTISSGGAEAAQVEFVARPSRSPRRSTWFTANRPHVVNPDPPRSSSPSERREI